MGLDKLLVIELVLKTSNLIASNPSNSSST